MRPGNRRNGLRQPCDNATVRSSGRSGFVGPAGRGYGIPGADATRDGAEAPSRVHTGPITRTEDQLMTIWLSAPPMVAVVTVAVPPRMSPMKLPVVPGPLSPVRQTVAVNPAVDFFTSPCR